VCVCVCVCKDVKTIGGDRGRLGTQLVVDASKCGKSQFMQ